MTEQEVQARVAFKINELMNALENRAGAYWWKAFKSGSQKEAHYWDAFKKLSEMAQKEIDMPVPYDDMAERQRKHERDKAVEALVSRFHPPGKRPNPNDVAFIVQIVSGLQR